MISDLYSHHEAHEAEHARKDGESALVDNTQDTSANAGNPKDEAYSTVLLVMASSKRPEYLKKTLHFVSLYHPKYGTAFFIANGQFEIDEHFLSIDRIY